MPGGGCALFLCLCAARPRLVGGVPQGRVAAKDWSAFDKFDYRTVKEGGGHCGSGFTSDSRKELIGRSPVTAYELGTNPRAYRGSVGLMA